MSFGFLASFGLIILAVVGVFVELPLVSEYAFWIAVFGYALLAGATFHHHHHRR
jgi:FtsH-binding integral membrane protein